VSGGGPPPDPCGGVGKTGPLTAQEFALLWRSVTDRSYWEPFVEQGEGQGYEAHTQAFQQYQRASLAVDRSTQQLYVLPWSGQTGDPASGGAYSTVELTFARGAKYVQELALVAGTLVEEIQVDFGEGGGVEVHTGRRYALTATTGLGPGDAGPLRVVAQAEAYGQGYDNPAPGTLRAVVQPGAGMFNEGATVVPGLAAHQLVMAPIPDVLLPEHVGQYVLFTSGANVGQVRRVSGYLPPNASATAPNGGTALLATTIVARFAASSGTFKQGEVVEQGPSGSTATAIVLYQTATHLVMDRVSGTMATGVFSVGVASSASAVFDSIDQDADLAAEAPSPPFSSGAGWRVLDWATDLGLTVTNAASPSGGKSPVLDQIGSDRQVFRGSGEEDADYREAVANLADVVSPNAIRRCINRALAPFGATGWLREVGTADLPGLYLDGDPLSTDPAEAYAYDLQFEGTPPTLTSAAGTYPVAFGGSMTFAWSVAEPPAPPQRATVFVAHGTTQAQLIKALNLAAGYDAFADAGGGRTSFSGALTGSGSTIQIVSIAFFTTVGTGFSAGAPVAGSDAVVRPEDRYKLLLDYTEFRAFFLVGVPPLSLGEFGAAFDDGPSNAFDASPFPCFFDGYPLTAACAYRTLWGAVNSARAGGVGFDLVLDAYGSL
jgi:hypothetical protein